MEIYGQFRKRDSRGRDSLRSHTCAGVTDGGYFYNHDPEGDTLYGADVYVDPDCRGLGVGSVLYEARRQLCRKLNLRRILAGGRLWNYPDYKDRYSMEGIRKLESFTPQFIDLMGGLARKYGVHIVAGSHPVAEHAFPFALAAILT